jgi:hypothetical protein
MKMIEHYYDDHDKKDWVVLKGKKKLMIKLEISLDGEEHWYYSVILFHVFNFPIWYGLMLFSDHYINNNYVNIHSRMYFVLGFYFWFL